MMHLHIFPRDAVHNTPDGKGQWCDAVPLTFLHLQDPSALEILMTDLQLMPPLIICTNLHISSTSIADHCCWFADTVRGIEILKF